MTSNIWSDLEKQIAQTAFQKAYHRETQGLIHHLSEQIQGVNDINCIWKLHDYLSAKRHQIDGRYYPIIHSPAQEIGSEQDYAGLIFIFAELFKEQWLLLEDLEGLAPDKIAKIKAISYL
ncbi:MAG: hypothetical protein ACKOX2_06755 [Microcystaceae cyanobacterium]